MQNKVYISDSLNGKKGKAFDEIFTNEPNVKIYPYADYTPFDTPTIEPSYLYIVISYLDNDKFDYIINEKKVHISYKHEIRRVYLKFYDVLPSKPYMEAPQIYVDTLSRVAKSVSTPEKLRKEFSNNRLKVEFGEEWIENSKKEFRNEICKNLDNIAPLIAEYGNIPEEIICTKDNLLVLYKINIQKIHDISVMLDNGEILYESEGCKRIDKRLLEDMYMFNI